MLASLFILTVSLALFVYWFRYSCLFLLRHREERTVVAPHQRFDFAEVGERLRTDLNLDPLDQTLDREYRVLTYLLDHAAGLGTPSVEERILMLDYKLMRAWYRVTRTAAPAQARKALSERAAILGFLAGKMDNQAGVHLEA
jgi:hypothetical protein